MFDAIQQTVALLVYTDLTSCMLDSTKVPEWVGTHPYVNTHSRVAETVVIVLCFMSCDQCIPAHVKTSTSSHLQPLIGSVDRAINIVQAHMAVCYAIK